MKFIGALALSAAAIFAATTMSAEAFDRYRYGGPDDGFSGSSDFFGQTLGGVASVATGLATPGLGYGYGNSPYYGSGYRYNSYGMSSYGYAQPYYVGTSGTLYPVVTGRSAAIDGFGKYCATPIKTCLLYEPSVLGNGCSCKVEGGHSRGSVMP